MNRVTQRLRSTALPLCIGTGLVLAAPACAAQAQTGMAIGPDLYARLAPPVFDFVVALARNVAIITYDARGGDPVTGEFWVDGLHIERDQLDVTIGRLTSGQNGLIATDVLVDTRGIDMPPEVRQMFDALDQDVVLFDLAIAGEGDASQADWNTTIALRAENLGRLVVQADVRGFHTLIPLDEFAGDGYPEDGSDDGDAGPEFRGSIAGGALIYTDDGLVPAALAIAAEMQGLEATDLAVGLSVQSQMLLSGLAGENTEQQALAASLSEGISGLVRDGAPLRITLDPAAPVPIQALIDMPPSLGWATLLGASVNTVPSISAEDVAALPPVDRARAYLEGEVVPQDPGEALRLATAAFDDGEADAAAVMLEAGRMTGALDPSRAYYLALLAKAEGAAQLDVVAAREGLDAAAVHETQGQAFEAWHGAEERPEYDALDLAARDGDGDAAAELAQRFRSGQGVPVNDARAYAYASVAAAHGDMIARMQRDTLARAVGRGLVAPAAIEAGAALASDIWGQVPARP